MKFRTLQSATRLLETLFSKTLDDYVAADVIYEIWDRSGYDKKKNKSWFSNLILHLKHYNLVESVYERRNGKNTLVGIKLTEHGKSFLGRDNSSSDENKSNQQTLFKSFNDTKEPKLSYDSMMKLVSRFQKENPEYKVEFSIRLKEEVS